MKQLSLSVTNRENHGRGHSRRLRISGSIPAIIYGPAGTHSVAVNRENFPRSYAQEGHRRCAY
jgi:ribosomal protein L25 (general stress protein Ctc)